MTLARRARSAALHQSLSDDLAIFSHGAKRLAVIFEGVIACGDTKLTGFHNLPARRYFC